MKTDLITRPPKRFFAFGCSFTDYFWATWANIIGEDLRLKYNTEFYNFGICGIGNEAIMNLVTQADAFHKFTKDDLVMICWTNIARIDRLIGLYWSPVGNIFTSSDRKLLKQISLDELLLKNLAYIHITNNFIKLRECQFHAMQMCQVDTVFNQMDPLYQTHLHYLKDLRSIYKETIASLKPSYYDVLWKGMCTPRLNWYDPHPSPSEHHNYLKELYLHNWEPEVLDKIQISDDRVDNQIQAQLKTGVMTTAQQRKFFTRGEGHKTNEEIIMQLLIHEGNSTTHLLGKEF